MNAYRRRGFTLVELLVVVVLGSILAIAIYQVLETNTRAHAVISARIQGQQTLGGAVDILSGELREISSQGGDLIVMGAHTLTFRAQRTFGLVCGVDYVGSSPEITAFRVGPTFQAGDSIFLLHDNDPDRASDDEWFGGTVTAVDTAVACVGSGGSQFPAQTLRVPFVGATATAFPPDSVRVGAPVRGFAVFTYGQYEMEGETYLGRQSRGASSPDPLIGPILPSGGVAFRYLDRLDRVTTVGTEVAQIEITLRFQAALQNFQNETVSDSILVRVNLRNSRK